VPKTEKIIAPSIPADAVLSHSAPEQVHDFPAGEGDARDQAHDHPHVGQHRRVGHARLVEHDLRPQFSRRGRGCAGRRGTRWRGRQHPLQLARGLRRRGRRNLAAGVEPLLLHFPGRRPVVRGAPLAGRLLTMVPPTAERTTQVLPSGVAGMGEEANLALRAVRHAALKLGLGLQNRIQRGLIVPDQRPGAIVLMPICAKRENLLDGNGKKASLSTILSSVLHTPSSYLPEANAPRGRPRFFVRHGRASPGTVGTNRQLPIAPPIHSFRPVHTDPLRARPSATTTWKKKALFFFPSSTAIHLSKDKAIQLSGKDIAEHRAGTVIFGGEMIVPDETGNRVGGKYYFDEGVLFK